MNAQIREEAARWLIEFRTDEPDAMARQGFARWLQASPENVREYLKLAAVWEEGGQMLSLSEPDSEELIRVARLDGANVIAFQSAPPLDVSPPAENLKRTERLVNTRRYVVPLAASLVALAGTLAAWFALNHDRVYSTELGEQRTLALSDGSTVELNALSSIRVRFTKSDRRVELVRGQALFNVVHDAARPFFVRSGTINVRDLGTQFDVVQGTSGTTVTVVEGRVDVLTSGPHPLTASSPVAAERVVEVLAGEQVTVASHAVSQSTPRPHKANLRTATAWTQQRLVFESTPLPDAAEEFNRFNIRQLRVDGATLAGFHVSGTFPARDPASLSRFVLFLREQPGVEVLEEDGEIVVRAK
jgi:transmembrane sensor